MPNEFRQLVFSRDELAQALANYHEDAEDSVPLGNIVFCQIMQNSDLRVMIKVLPDGETQVQSRELGVDVIARALMKYCQDNKIPMPRNSEKSIEAIGENIAMTVSIDRTSIRLSGDI